MSKNRIVLLMLAIGIVAVVSAACSSGEPAAPAATQTQAGQQADATAANTATGGEEAEPVVSTGRTGSEKLAPDLKAIDGWINTGAFTLESLRGQIVLVDFWTYTCINCIRTLPYLKDWHDKYAGAGLAIVGVHTPEFEFEKDYDNVLSAVMEYGLKYRIAQDNDYGTWRAFNNRYWPAKYLIDKDGYIRYTHFGEGAYEETEQKIRELLAEAGADLSARAFQALNEREYDPAVYTDDPSMSLTRELYAGYERNYSAAQSRVAPPYVRNLEYYTTPGADLNYNDPGNYENHYIYLQGRWHNGPESIIHSRTTEANEDYIAIKFYGTSANAVMSPPAGGETRVVATLDGMPLTEAQAGLDIMWDDEGRSYILIHSSRMYSIVNIDSFSGHELRLSSNDEGFELFAYTFGGFKGGY